MPIPTQARKNMQANFIFLLKFGQYSGNSQRLGVYIVTYKLHPIRSACKSFHSLLSAVLAKNAKRTESRRGRHEKSGTSMAWKTEQPTTKCAKIAKESRNSLFNCKPQDGPIFMPWATADEDRS
jgi:hypothetical protein